MRAARSTAASPSGTRTTGTPRAPRAPARRRHAPTSCIVGGGYTGLWTAYYLKKAAPFLRVTVLEQKFCGYGASGRNGGWLYNGIAGRDRYAKLHGHEAAVRLQQAMNETVDEVVRVAAEEGIDADIHQGGVLEVAYTPAQLARLKAFHAAELAVRREATASSTAPRETAERIRRRGRRRLGLDPARRAPAPGQARQGPGRRRRGASASRSTSRRPVTEIQPKHAVTRTAPSAPRTSCAAPRASPPRLKGQQRTWLPDELLHDRDRAAAARDLGRHRLGGPRDPRRHGARLHVRPAHRRRPHRARRPRRPVPLRLRAPTTTAAPSRPPSRRCARSWSASSPPPPASASTTPGRASSASPATGAPPSPWTAPRASAGPAATSAPGSRPRTSRPAPCAT